MSIFSHLGAVSIVAIASVIFASGCCKPKQIVNPISTDTIEELRAQVRAHHLHLNIFKSISGPGFIGTVWHEGDTETSRCLEDGAQPKWTSGYVDSQQEAARVLLKKMAEPPNSLPSTCPKDIRE